MAKSIEKIKSGLKLRTQAKPGSLTLRIGVRKFVLPFETRMLNSEEYVFVHIPPSAEILKISDEGLTVVTNADEAEAAVATFRKGRKKSGGGRRRSAPQMPDELASLLSKLEPGTKIGYDKDGNPKLVKTRKRQPKK